MTDSTGSLVMDKMCGQVLYHRCGLLPNTLLSTTDRW